MIDNVTPLDDLAAEALDLRTLEEIEDAHDAAVASLIETVTGRPARPGVIR